MSVRKRFADYWILTDSSWRFIGSAVVAGFLLALLAASAFGQVCTSPTYTGPLSTQPENCTGGTRDGLYCYDNGDCPSGTCGNINAAAQCVGGTNDGGACNHPFDCPGSGARCGHPGSMDAADDLWDNLALLCTAADAVFTPTDIDTDYGDETVTSTWSFNDIADHAWSPATFDLDIGDGVDEGQVRLGNLIIGQADDTVATTVMDDIAIFYNASDSVENISYVFFDGSSGDPRFIIAEAGVDHATYNPRSLLIGPAATVANMDENILCSTNFSSIDCDTAGSGADLGVQDDIEVGGQIFVAGNVDGVDISAHAASATTHHTVFTPAANPGTDHSDLGATPNGELGGTWAAITVDATHSGSAHHAVFSPTAGVAIDHGAESVAISDLADGTDGELITWDGTGEAATVAVGTATHVLTSNGVGVPPTFQAAAGGDLVDDTTPQLGGQLDVNGFAIGDGTLELLAFIETGSAINEVTITNAAIGGRPTISATGDDTNIDLSLQAKGSGVLVVPARIEASLVDSNTYIEFEGADAINIVTGNARAIRWKEAAAVVTTTLYGGQTGFDEALVVTGTDSSDVNYTQITATNTGVGPTIEAKGDDTDIDLNLAGQGTGLIALGSPLLVDSNAANSVAITTFENTAGDIQIFRVDADPEASLTASIGDFAIDSTNGSLHFKQSGSATNTGWQDIAGSPTFKSYTFAARSAASGEFFQAGFYDFPTTDVTLTIGGSVTQTHGGANAPYAAHAFAVASGAGGTDLVLTVSGTSITDAGARVTSDTEIIVADTDAAILDQYFETAKKWLGTITYTLTGSSGAFTFNYGYSKYEDFGNRKFTVTDFESVGLANANDSGFNIELLYHSSTGWTYAASGFQAGGTILVSMNTVHSTEQDLDDGEPFAFKRSGLSQDVAGDGGEGIIVRVTTGANNSVSYMDSHVGVIIR